MISTEARATFEDGSQIRVIWAGPDFDEPRADGIRQTYTVTVRKGDILLDKDMIHSAGWAAPDPVEALATAVASYGAAAKKRYKGRAGINGSDLERWAFLHAGELTELGESIDEHTHLRTYFH